LFPGFSRGWRPGLQSVLSASFRPFPLRSGGDVAPLDEPAGAGTAHLGECDLCIPPAVLGSATIGA
jgi:hypothetical protein